MWRGAEGLGCLEPAMPFSPAYHHLCTFSQEHSQFHLCPTPSPTQVCPSFSQPDNASRASLPCKREWVSSPLQPCLG